MSSTNVTAQALRHGMVMETPNGDRYSVFWDDTREEVVLTLEIPGNNLTHSLSMVVYPMAGNSVAIGPKRRAREEKAR